MFLILFIFGVMGVRLFGRIPVDGNPGLTHNLNFSNLYYALGLLFTISTTETWPDVMEGCQLRPEGCEATDSCGSWVAVPFFLIYMLLAACVILNAIIMVVLSHFDTTADPGKDLFEDLKKVRPHTRPLRGVPFGGGGCGAHCTGAVGLSTAGGQGSIEPPKNWGGSGKRAQLTGPLISYHELWGRRRRKFYFRQTSGK